MLPSLQFNSAPATHLFDSENSIALAKRMRYFVANTHRQHADFRFRHAEIRFRAPEAHGS
jgi:hypothetical protein